VCQFHCLLIIIVAVMLIIIVTVMLLLIIIVAVMLIMMCITVSEIISDTTEVWKLKFTSLQSEDFGSYTCEARNDLGIAVGTITLSR